MKFVGLMLLTTSFSVFALSGALDGQKYCRQVQTAGFGQPAGVRSHCVAFAGGQMTDNASTFFGNPPSKNTYELVGKNIVNVDTNKKTEYVLEKGALKIRSINALLTLVK